MEQLEQCSVAQSAECTPTGGKRCSMCQKMYPASENYFSRSKRTKDGLLGGCKRCYASNKSTFTTKITGMVFCSHCKRHLPKSAEFFYKKELADNCFRGSCISCRSENASILLAESPMKRDEARGRISRWISKNKERKNSASRAWKNKNKQKVKDSARSYSKNNRWALLEKDARRRFAKKNAKPSWYECEIESIRNVYKKARELGFHVDHIVPLQSDIVCGLHCLANLQIMEPSKNQSKGNYWWPDMP